MQRCHASYRDAVSLEASWHEAAADDARLSSIQVACARAAAQESCVRARAGGTPACATRAIFASARPPGGASPSATPWLSWKSCMPPCAAASLRVRHTTPKHLSPQPSDLHPANRLPPFPPSPLMIIMPEGAMGHSAASSVRAHADACRLCGRDGQKGSAAGGCHACSGACRRARAAAPAGGEAGGCSSLRAARPQLQPQGKEAQKGEVSHCVNHTCTWLMHTAACSAASEIKVKQCKGTTSWSSRRNGKFCTPMGGLHARMPPHVCCGLFPNQ